jgi:hypothetical protein
VRELIQMVVIDLAADENAKEIFETLNAGGAQVTAADLIKNFVFQRCSKPARTSRMRTKTTGRNALGGRRTAGPVKSLGHMLRGRAPHPPLAYRESVAYWKYEGGRGFCVPGAPPEDGEGLPSNRRNQECNKIGAIWSHPR